MQTVDACPAFRGLREAAEVNGKTVPDPGLLGVVPDGIHGEIDLPAVRSRSSFLQGKVNSPLFLRMRQAAFAAPGNHLEKSGTVRRAQVDLDHIEPMMTSFPVDLIDYVANRCATVASGCVIGLGRTCKP